MSNPVFFRLTCHNFLLIYYLNGFFTGAMSSLELEVALKAEAAGIESASVSGFLRMGLTWASS